MRIRIILGLFTAIMIGTANPLWGDDTVKIKTPTLQFTGLGVSGYVEVKTPALTMMGLKAEELATDPLEWTGKGATPPKKKSGKKVPEEFPGEEESFRGARLAPDTARSGERLRETAKTFRGFRAQLEEEEIEVPR